MECGNFQGVRNSNFRGRQASLEADWLNQPSVESRRGFERCQKLRTVV